MRIVKYLIKQGAYLQAKDIIGRTPLCLALYHKHYNIAKELLMNFASPWSHNLK